METFSEILKSRVSEYAPLESIMAYDGRPIIWDYLHSFSVSVNGSCAISITLPEHLQQLRVYMIVINNLSGNALTVINLLAGAMDYAVIQQEERTLYRFPSDVNSANMTRLNKSDTILLLKGDALQIGVTLTTADKLDVHIRGLTNKPFKPEVELLGNTINSKSFYANHNKLRGSLDV